MMIKVIQMSGQIVTQHMYVKQSVNATLVTCEEKKNREHRMDMYKAIRSLKTLTGACRPKMGLKLFVGHVAMILSWD